MTPDWMELANCRGKPTDKFFPSHNWPSSEPAKVICSGCKVKDECLEYALSFRGLLGVWGGATERERRAIRARRRRRAA